MLIVSSPNVNMAWKESFLRLYMDFPDIGGEKYARDEVALIEVEKPSLDYPDHNFPMSPREIDVINNYMKTGVGEEMVVHEWTKIYRHRLFDQPNSQIEYMLEKLRDSKVTGEVQASLWDKNIDQHANISPCTQIIWARIKNGKIELHVHAHSSDAYKKSLMNMQEFISLQLFFASELKVPVGKYFHFFDSLHLHRVDLSDIDELAAKLKEDGHEG